MSKRSVSRRSLWKREAVRSGLEARIKKQLEEDGIPFEYESVKLPYTITKHKKYTPDFIFPNGLYLEAKGRLTSESREKMIAVKEAHPDINLRILFQRDQPIRKGSKTLYSTWAEKCGFIWAVGEQIPEEWIKERKKK